MKPVFAASPNLTFFFFPKKLRHTPGLWFILCWFIIQTWPFFLVFFRSGTFLNFVRQIGWHLKKKKVHGGTGVTDNLALPLSLLHYWEKWKSEQVQSSRRLGCANCQFCACEQVWDIKVKCLCKCLLAWVSVWVFAEPFKFIAWCFLSVSGLTFWSDSEWLSWLENAG